MQLSQLNFAQVSDEIRNEISELLKQNIKVPEPVFFKAPIMFAEAVRTRNPFYTDKAVTLCNLYDFELTPTMQKVVAATSVARISGAPSGTFEKIQRDGRNEAAAGWTAHLVAVGNTIEEASEKAASLYELNFPHVKPKKASSISKYYEDNFRDRSPLGRTTQQVIEELQENDKELRRYWQEISDNTPRTQKNKGNRRQ